MEKARARLRAKPRPRSNSEDGEGMMQCTTVMGCDYAVGDVTGGEVSRGSLDAVFLVFGRLRGGRRPSAIRLSALNSDLPVARHSAWKRDSGLARSLAGASCTHSESAPEVTSSTTTHVFEDATLVHDQDVVKVDDLMRAPSSIEGSRGDNQGRTDRSQPVSNHQERRVGKLGADGLVDELVALVVNRRRLPEASDPTPHFNRHAYRFVEEQQFRPLEERSGHAEQLPLPLREIGALFRDLGLAVLSSTSQPTPTDGRTDEATHRLRKTTSLTPSSSGGWAGMRLTRFRLSRISWSSNSSKTSSAAIAET